MTALAYHIWRPAVVWALHFTTIYALISAACAPRALLEVQTAQMLALAATLGAAALVLFWVGTGMRNLSRLPKDAPERSLAQAAVWAATISLVAILIDLWPMATLSSCAG